MSKLYDLTFPQKNIWLVESFYDNSIINILAGSLVINSDFNIDIAEKTVNKFVELNDGMRIRLNIEDSVPKQYIYPYEVFSSKKQNVSKLSEEEIDNIKKNYIKTPFNLKGGFLFDALLLDKGKGKGEILIKVHHIISDAWALSKTATYLSEIYENFLNNTNDFIIQPSYIEYIESEKNYTNSDKYIKDGEFWQEYLLGLKESIGIKEKIIVGETKAKRYSMKLEKDFNNMILDFCKENRTSPYAVFLTALAIYIHRTTEKEDFVIGTPVLNRSNYKEKMMQGMFISTIPVRFRIDEKNTFLDMCKKSISESMNLFRHQKYPLFKTVEEYKKNNDTNDNIYKVILSYQNARSNFSIENKYETYWLFNENVQTQFEMHIMDFDDSGTLSIHFDYLNSMFNEIEIKYIANRLLAIIEDGIKNNKTIEDIKIIPEEEKNKIYEFNNTKAEYEKKKNIIELFEEQVEKTPNNIALIFKDQKMTYKELNEKSNQVANYLVKDRKIKPNDVIGIIQERSFEMIISIFGVMKSGATYIPINPDFPEGRIKYILNDSNSKIVLSEKFELSQSIKISDILNKSKEKSNLINKPNSEDIIYIIYTSGTTGNPKGVMISHKSLTNLLFAMDEIKKISKCSTALSMSNYTFDMFIIESILPLVLGLKMIVADDNESIMPNKISELVDKYKIEVIFITPTKLELIERKEEYINKFRSVRKITIAGENFREKLLENIIRNMPLADIFNGYGPTESTVCTTIHKIIKNEKITIGKCIGNITGYILDSKSRLMPLMVEGELCIGGAGLFKGYLNDEVTTNSKMVNYNGKKLYKSGDKCLINFDLNLEYFSRLDNQVKIHGLRIELEEIEQAILKIDSVKNCVVLIKNDMLVSFIIPNKSKEINTDMIKKQLSKRLPNYMIPNNYFYIKKLPITSSGKIDKNKLINEYNIVNEIDKEENVKYNRIQSQIFNVIKDSTKISKKMKLDESIMSFSIDSLDMINIALKLEEIFGVNISVNELFANNTIIKIEEMIKNRRSSRKPQYFEKDIDLDTKLSKNQKNIFVSYSLNPNDTTYNMSCDIKLDKELDTEELRTNIEEVINNNIVFKSNITIENEDIKLSANINKSIKASIKNMPEEEYIEYRYNFVQPFDLLEDDLIRVEIIETEKNKYIIFDTHHVIFDGLSMPVFFKKLQDVFKGKKLKQDRSYFKYLNYINKIKNTEEYIESKKYFGDMLSNEIPETYIEPDFTRGSTRSFYGDALEKIIDSEVGIKINKYCRENEITPNALFLGVIQILLSKYTYNDQVILGMITNGRKTYEYMNTIGMFVNTLPYLTNINWNMYINEYLKQVGRDVFNLIEKDICDIDELINEIGIKRDTSKNALFDIAYTYQNFNNKELNISDKKIEINELNDEVSKFDIAFEITPLKNKYKIAINYVSSLYKTSTIENLLEHISNIIEYIVINKVEFLKDINLISKTEKRLILNKFNNTKIDYESKTTIQNKISKAIKSNYDKIAIVDEGTNITYNELDLESNKVANMLINKKVNPNDRIAVLMDKSIDYLITIIGILKAGGVYVPIDVEFPSERQKYMIDSVDVKYIITNSKYDNKELKYNNKICLQEKEQFNSNDVSNRNKYSDMAYIMYTSGTTGNPKGVIITHKNVIRLVDNTNYIKPNSKDRVLQTGAIGFDATTFEYFYSLFNGLTLYLIPKSIMLDMKQFNDYIINNKISVMFLTSQLFKSIVQYNENVFENVRVLLTGGEILSSKHSNKVLENCPNLLLYNVYGPTENTTFSTYYKIEKKFEQNNIPIGKPIANTTCYIVDKCGNLCPIKVPGELWLGGDGVSKGYYSNEILTNEKFVNNDFVNNNELLYKSGDLVSWDVNGNINFLGRIDKQIKIRGFRIELDEIKLRLEQIEKVKDSFVIAEKNNGDYYINAYIVSDEKLDLKLIKKELKNKIPYYMLPKNIIQVDKILMNINGKVDVNKLPKIEDTNERDYILPKTEMEHKIYNVWKKVLKHDNFGINEDFFEIGGDSLLASEVVIVLLSEDIKITYADLFKNTTVFELAKFIENQESVIDTQDIEEIDYNKYSDILNVNMVNNQENENFEDNEYNILLTGGTGFLGAHIIDSYMKNTNSKIYCLVRSKSNESPEQRLKEKLNFFFGKKYDSFIGNRIIIVEGDITNKYLINKIDLDVIQNIDVVLNSAAEVKHFGEEKLFTRINIEGTKNIIEFCKKYNKKLVHISTLSVSGNVSEGGNEEQDISTLTYFREDNLYIGQKITNLYVKSKFLAEKHILDAIIDYNLNAKIIRVGNLTGRFSDGKFQPNVEENAFSNRIRSMLYLKSIPENIEKLYAEFTPIDICAYMVQKITNLETKQNIYHLFNDNHVPVYDMIHILNDLGFVVKIITTSKFADKIKDLSKIDYSSVAIKGIIADLNKNTELNYISNIIVKAEKTNNIMQKLGLKWPNITAEYINKYINYLCSIGYINKEEM